MDPTDAGPDCPARRTKASPAGVPNPHHNQVPLSDRARAFLEVGLGLIPIVYVAGFLAWSVYSVGHGLGLLPLLTAQYLAAGGFLVLNLVISLGFLWLFLQSLRSPARPKSEINLRFAVLQFLKVGGVVFLSYFAGSTMFLGLLGGVALRFDILEYAGTFAFVGLLLAAISILLVGFFTFWRKVSDDESDHDAPTADKTGEGPDSGAPGLLGGEDLAILFSGMAIVSLFVFSTVIMPDMDGAYGGARVRVAALDLDPADLSPKTMDRLWPEWNGTTESGRIVQSPDVQVLFVHDESIWVRPIDEGAATGQLFEISRYIIHGITWRSS